MIFVPFMPEEHGCKRVMCITNVSSGFSHVQLFVTPWAVALQASLSMGFSRLLCPWDSPGFSAHGILQASLSMGFSRLLCPWDSPGFSAHGILQASLSMGFSRQEYQSGLPCPPPEDLPLPGIRNTSLSSPPLPGGLLTTGTTWEFRITSAWVQVSLQSPSLGYSTQMLSTHLFRPQKSVWNPIPMSLEKGYCMKGYECYSQCERWPILWTLWSIWTVKVLI